jgi:hypothetical protein
MLTIRHEQMESLREARMQVFRERLHTFLFNIPEKDLAAITAEQVHAEIDSLLKLAADFHIKRESDIARLGELLCCEFGSISKAKLSRAALKILYPYGVDPTEKLDQFRHWLANHTDTVKPHA